MKVISDLERHICVLDAVADIHGAEVLSASLVESVRARPHQVPEHGCGAGGGVFLDTPAAMGRAVGRDVVEEVWLEDDIVLL
jgi:hypothetical protein